MSSQNRVVWEEAWLSAVASAPQCLAAWESLVPLLQDKQEVKGETNWACFSRSPGHRRGPELTIQAVLGPVRHEQSFHGTGRWWSGRAPRILFVKCLYLLKPISLSRSLFFFVEGELVVSSSQAQTGTAEETVNALGNCKRSRGWEREVFSEMFAS